MAFIAPHVGKFLKYFSLAEDSFFDVSSWAKSPYLPALHVLLITLIVVLVIHLFISTRKKKQKDEKPFQDNADRSHTKSEHLVWINKILSWLFLSSNPLLPHYVKSWIENLNLHLANQKRNVGALVYGLREGSGMPSITEIKNVAIIGNSVHADVQLRSTEFGFLISMGGNGRRNGVTEATYSAIVTQFECWFSLILTNVNGVVGLILKPIEKKPVFQINMKPLSKNQHQSFKPEVIAQSLQEAVLETTIYANIDVTNDQPAYEGSPGSEKSFPSDTDEENENAHSSGQIIKEEFQNNNHLQAFDHRRFTENNLMHSLSAPGSPCPTPATNFPPLSNQSNEPRSGSFGSLTNLTRTSASGRGPAKPIRIREKSLVVNEILFQSENSGEFYPLLCTFELNHPPQSKTINLPSNSIRCTLTFDLSARSSGLNVTLQNTSETKETLHLKGSVTIDGLNFDKDPNVLVKVLLGSDSTAGILQLKLHMKENQDQTQVARSAKKSHSFAGVDKMAKQNSMKTSPSNHAASDASNVLGETKVTTVTKVTKSTKTPPKQETEVKPNHDRGVSFDSSSVAETVLKDLSKKTSPAHKTKILITAVEKSSDSPTSELTEESDRNEEQFIDSKRIAELREQNDDSLLSTSSDLPSVVFTSGTPPPTPKPGFEDESEVKVRRTQSLVFRSARKSKDKRLSAMHADESSTSDLISPRSTTSLNRKSSSRLSKIFGKKKKKKLETLEDESSLADVSLLSSGDGQVVSSSPGSTKVKRSRSLKKLIKRKNKSGDS